MEKNKKTIDILLILIMILVVIGCIVTFLYFTKVDESTNDKILFDLKDYPKVDGAISTLALNEAYESAFTGKSTENLSITHSKTENAYLNLINGDVDLILVPYPTDEELEIARKTGVELEMVPVAKEAFVFFVNKENSVENLTLGQIQQIYSGKITNWKSVGGEDSSIIAYQCPSTSENQKGMLSLIMNGTKMKNPDTENISQTNSDIINVITEYENKENAIGYSYYYYTTSLYKDENIKLLSIDGIQPSYDNIRTGLDRFQTTDYAVIRKNESKDSNTRKLLNAMVSENGQNIVKEAGYVQNN